MCVISLGMYASICLAIHLSKSLLLIPLRFTQAEEACQYSSKLVEVVIPTSRD